MANKLDIKMNLPGDAEIKAMFDAVPILERRGVADKVIRAGAKPIVKRARQLAPRGNETDRRKRSKKQKQSANWNIPLFKTIALVVRKYQKTNGVGIIGPRYPDGNKAYFNTSLRGRRQVLWGHRTGRVLPQIRNWIVQAFDETRQEQNAAMKAKLKQLLDEIWKTNGRRG